MNTVSVTCKIVDCDKPRAPGRKDWCTMHYTRWRNNGDPLISKIDRSIKHVTKMTEYKSWQGMKDRCYKTSHQNYPNYGGRGITICDRWLKSFANFYEDMGNKPTSNHSIDRIDNDGDYEPNNCKWSTRREQASNRRSNILFTINSETKTLKQWCDQKGLKYKTVHARIVRGIQFIDALY